MSDDKSLRFYVDQRVSCIAVRDRTKVDPESSCLEFDSPGVVIYHHGKLVQKFCPTCKQSIAPDWVIPESVIRECHELCDQLNKNDQPKEDTLGLSVEEDDEKECPHCHQDYEGEECPNCGDN